MFIHPGRGKEMSQTIQYEFCRDRQPSTHLCTLGCLPFFKNGFHNFIRESRIENAPKFRSEERGKPNYMAWKKKTNTKFFYKLK